MRNARRIGRQRRRRGWRVRNAVKRYSTRPRLSVFRSHKHMYAQVVDDETGKTLASAGTVEKELRDVVGYGGNKQAAAAVGKLLAERALKAGVTQVAFDRRDYKYHGRVAALADAARDAGLDLGAKKVAEEKPAEAKKPAKGAKPASDEKKAEKKPKKGADSKASNS